MASIPTMTVTVHVRRHKNWLASRTIWLNVVLAAVALLAEVKPILPQGWLTYYPFVCFVLNVVMRFLSGQPIVPQPPVTETTQPEAQQ